AQGNSENKGRGKDKQEKAESRGQSGKQHADKKSNGKSRVDRDDDKDRGKSNKANKSTNVAGRDDDDRSRRSNRFARAVSRNDLRPELRRFAASERARERVAAGALARTHARGINNGVVMTTNGDRVRLVNRSGVLLVDLDDKRARELGQWRVTPYNDEIRSNAPAFCRSGAGHPVFGRQWCMDKGFGLGSENDLRWGRANVTDIRFARTADTGELVRGVLVDVLGDAVFNRLGLHAVTLGYSDPLSGQWYGEPSGPRVLRVTSGGYPVAEIVDNNRDDRADVLVVALRPW
ncbi:MAG TPA: hypothetical protein VF051_00900, partial [Hyphomicrobiaceae bacterium]